ncbi:phosphotransferase family protein [Bacillus sp. EB600]|uniref:phosphotransferase family protein n=1 Tax=Bacillus sp. EB600 TaxID=2806345 RepID=UPI00210B66F3|nr:phosphotransferase family protein [Bacillus sp. EB600]MCQ6281651.1 phosphotransferase family protein [Bacillus sp. EB600]
MTNISSLDSVIEARIKELSNRYRCESYLDELLSDKLRKRVTFKDKRPSVSIDDPEGRLKEFFSDHIEESFTISDVQRLKGGGANEGYRFILTRGSKIEKLVLRLKTLGAICATAAPREFQMLNVVKEIMPTPQPRWLVTDPKYFGEMACITSFVPGVASPSRNVPKATGLGVAYGEELRQKLAPQFIEYYAKLHSYNWSGQNLSYFDIPQPNTTDAIDWRLAFWERSWEQDKIESHPTMILMKQWLWENRPVVDHVSLLHGDFRNGNFLFDEESGKINGIIDWELSYLGDRHSDLAYTMLPGWGSFDEKGNFLVAGLVDTETFIAEYERISGLKIDHSRLHYYFVYNYYWSIVSLIGTGIKNADLKITQLDVMYNFIAGLGGRFIDDVNKLILEDIL